MESSEAKAAASLSSESAASPSAEKRSSAAAQGEVFVSSGNSALERRLVETFAALKLPRSAPHSANAVLERPKSHARKSTSSEDGTSGGEEDAAGSGFPSRAFQEHLVEERVPSAAPPPASPSESPISGGSDVSESTVCTQTGAAEASPSTPQPPPFGQWRLYTLADVGDEQMSAQAMQRAADLLIAQRREAKREAPGSGGASPAEDAEGNSRVHIGPRRVAR